MRHKIIYAKHRIIFAVLTALSLIITLAGCGEQLAFYKTDVPVSELCTAADAKISDSDTMTEMTSDYIKGMMDIDTDSFSEYTVKVQASGANVNEYGIFKAPSDEAVTGIEDTVKEYLAKRVNSWMPEYMPEEFPKVQKATCKVIGQYVVYCILPDDERSEVYTAIENTLLGK